MLILPSAGQESNVAQPTTSKWSSFSFFTVFGRLTVVSVSFCSFIKGGLPRKFANFQSIPINRKGKWGDIWGGGGGEEGKGGGSKQTKKSDSRTCACVSSLPATGDNGNRSASGSSGAKPVAFVRFRRQPSDGRRRRIRLDRNTQKRAPYSAGF